MLRPGALLAASTVTAVGAICYYRSNKQQKSVNYDRSTLAKHLKFSLSDYLIVSYCAEFNAVLQLEAKPSLVDAKVWLLVIHNLVHSSVYIITVTNDQRSPLWQGLPLVINPFLPQAPKSSPLSLIAVGMRRKNFYVVDVDVYLIGISMADDTLKVAKQWMSRGDGKSLVDSIFNSYNLLSSSPSKVTLSATLRFCRGATTAQFLNAFEEALKGCDQVAVEDFKKGFSELITTGIKEKDEFVLYWLDNGDVLVSMNGQTGSVLSNKGLNKRLLEVYIDPKRTVSPELLHSLEHNIQQAS